MLSRLSSSDQQTRRQQLSSTSWCTKRKKTVGSCCLTGPVHLWLPVTAPRMQQQISVAFGSFVEIKPGDEPQEQQGVKRDASEMEVDLA